MYLSPLTAETPGSDRAQCRCSHTAHPILNECLDNSGILTIGATQMEELDGGVPFQDLQESFQGKRLGSGAGTEGDVFDGNWEIALRCELTSISATREPLS